MEKRSKTAGANTPSAKKEKMPAQTKATAKKPVKQGSKPSTTAVVKVLAKSPAKPAPAPSKKPAPPKSPAKPAAKPVVKPAAKPAATPPKKTPPAKTEAKPAVTPVKALAPAPEKQTLPKKDGKADAAKAVPERAAHTIKQGAMLPAQFLSDLAMAIKEGVEPAARAVKGREVVDTAITGDVTFQLDRTAEKILMNFLKRAGLPVAYYSEDAGYTTFTTEKPKYLLIVDPIDGSRAARSGFEGCVVSVASTRVIERPTMADLDNAFVVELLGDRSFYAEKDKGVKMHAGAQVKRPKLSANSTLENLTWSMTVPARPAELIFPTAARLIDYSSLKGGFFACNSTAFSLTRLLTNQLDACIDFANRFYRDIPDRVRSLFEGAGCGRVIGIAPYDMAAAYLIAKEAGCIVTDAYGHDFDEVLLLDSSESNHQSLVAAANKELHGKLLAFLDNRIRRMEALLAKSG